MTKKHAPSAVDTAEADDAEHGHAAARALARLTHHRWCLLVLAHIAAQRGCKFVTLSRQLGVTPESLKRALLRLAELELVMRNPGYGHPMRPEYILGPRGGAVSDAAEALVAWIRRHALDDDVLRKWHLPVLLVVADGERRFGDVRTALPEATPRALTLALKGLASAGLLTRRVEDGYPPTPHYRITRRGAAARSPLEVLGTELSNALFG